jgi:hypothetical protein
MFRKLVSNLAFSPALVGQLSFYANRLKKEELTRRLGLIFTVLALVVQSFAVFTPPEPANAATPGQVGSSPRCNVESVGPRDNAFSINDNNKAVVSFDVSGGKNCKVQLSVNTFFAPSMNGTPYEQQILHDRSTQVFDTPGRYTMRAAMPEKSNANKGCFYQVDLTYGTSNVLPVLAYGHGKLDCGGAALNPQIVCTNLTVVKLPSNRFSLKGTGDATNATIKKYVFTITLPNGQTVEKTQATDAKSATVDYENSTPGNYNVKLTVIGSAGQDSGPACKASFTVDTPTVPLTACGNVTATISNRSQAYFTGSAQASGGATIKSYTFIVKNKLGVEIKRATVNSAALTATAPVVDLSTAGDYTVQLVVQTSLGDKTNNDSCVKPFTIAPPDVCQYNPELPPSSPDCQPCPDNPDVWVKDEKCTSTLISSKTATNMSRGVNATTVTAQGGDKLTYTITVENKGLVSDTVTMQEDLTDVLEYATLIDRGGATFNEQNKTLTWPAVTLKAGEKQVRTLAVQLMKDIPATNTGTGIKTSYDCAIANTFGNTVTVGVECPPQKVIVEQIVGELPTTGPRENMIFAGILLSIVAYFYARSRQTGKEIRLIRRDINAGTI